MKSHFRFPLAAFGLLAFLTNCATTVTEKEKPSNTSQPMSMPAVTDARRPDSTGAAASATDARITAEANTMAATSATPVAPDAARLCLVIPVDLFDGAHPPFRTEPFRTEPSSTEPSSFDCAT